MHEWRAANPERAKAINTQPSREAKERFRKSERGMELARAKALRHYHKDAEASRAKEKARREARLGRPARVPMTEAERAAANRQKAQRYRDKDREAARARNRAHYAANRDVHIQKVVDRSKRVRHATPPWADRQAIAAIYREARRLTRATGIPHHVDHDIPLRGKRVHGLHVETNLVVLPAVVNQAKSNQFQGA